MSTTYLQRWISISEEAGGIPCEKGQREGCTALGNSDMINTLLSFCLQSRRLVKYSMSYQKLSAFHCITPENMRIKAEKATFGSIPKTSPEVPGHEGQGSGWICITQKA